MAVMARIASAVTSFFTKNAGAAANAAKRLGMPGITPAKLGALAKANPMTAALIALDMGVAGNEIRKMLEELPPEQLGQISMLIHENDDAPDSGTPLADLNQYADEMKIIKDAADIIGGLERLMIVKEALAMDKGLYQLFIELKQMRF